MRAATRKPGWYIRRGITVPDAVIRYRLKMVLKKEQRRERHRAAVEAADGGCPEQATHATRAVSEA